MQSCSYTITTIENDPALFFVFPCISMNIYATCTADQMAATWTKSNLNEFIFKKITYLINSFIQFTVHECRWLPSKVKPMGCSYSYLEH